MPRWEWTHPTSKRTFIVYRRTKADALMSFAAFSSFINVSHIRELPPIEQEGRIVVEDARKAPGV